MKAAVYIDAARIVTRETQEPTLQPGDVMLRVRACGVCGTDVAKVRYGLIRPPAILGHEVAGDVVALGPGVTKFSVGDRVVVAHHTPCYACTYCRHGNYSMCPKFKASNLDPGGFAEFVRVPAGHVEMTAHRIPEGMTYERAIFMEPLACVVRNLKRTTILPGDTALVIGLGSMGLLTGQLLRRYPAQVIGSDLRADRCAIAKSLGFTSVVSGEATDLERTVRNLTEGRGVDLVILTAGDAKLYGQAIQYLRDGGAISIFAGLAPGSLVSYDAYELYRREITVYSSYSPSPAELTEALEHLRQGTVNVDVLAPKNYALDEVSMAIEEVLHQSVLKAIVQPSGVSP